MLNANKNATTITVRMTRVIAMTSTSTTAQPSAHGPKSAMAYARKTATLNNVHTTEMTATNWNAAKRSTVYTYMKTAMASSETESATRSATTLSASSMKVIASIRTNSTATRTAPGLG